MEQLTFIDGMKPEEPKTKKDWVGGFRSVVGCLGASNHTKEEREENDYYATDPEAMEWLLKLENIGPEVWEPAEAATFQKLWKHTASKFAARIL